MPGVIRLDMTRSVAHNVVKEKTTVDMMKALSCMYERPLANKKVYLMKKLFNLKMVECTPVMRKRKRKFEESKFNLDEKEKD